MINIINNIVMKIAKHLVTKGYQKWQESAARVGFSGKSSLLILPICLISLISNGKLNWYSGLCIIKISLISLIFGHMFEH